MVCIISCISIKPGYHNYSLTTVLQLIQTERILLFATDIKTVIAAILCDNKINESITLILFYQFV